MRTRRDFILGLTFGPCIVAAAAGEFWESQPSAQWTENDVERLLTKSPWAKQVAVEFGGGGFGGPDMGGPGMGPPGDFGGPGGRGGPGGMAAVVRWETALPVREARKKQLGEGDAAGVYIVSISGLSMLSELGFTLDASGVEAMKKASFLQRNGGKKNVAPSSITMSFDESGVLLYQFPKDDPIQPDDKQVLFETKTSMFALKAKFVPKEMVYRGKLSL